MNGLFHLLIDGVYWGEISYKPLILTLDPITSNGTSKIFFYFGRGFRILRVG